MPVQTDPVFLPLKDLRSLGMSHENETQSRRGRDELADLKQFNRESVANFVFRFCATCLKIADLSEAEKLDRVVRALVSDIRLQVELRGPRDFHEAAVFTERADSVISRIPG